MDGTADHDSAVLPELDRFDVTRRATSHLTFGHGDARNRIGAPSVRVELQVALAQLVPAG